MKSILSLALLGLMTASLAASPVQASLVLGVFDSTRATTANLATGNFTSQLNASLTAHFPGVSYAATPTLTPQFLAGVNILVIAPDKTDTVGITPLSASEQSALLNYVLAGGNAFLVVDGFSPFIPAAQSMVSPFGMTIVDDGLTGVLGVTPTTQAHPVINGPFGDTTSFSVFGAGLFTSLGPHAVSLATMNATGLPVLAVIGPHALGPNSGRVVLITDSSLFVDSTLGGFFPQSETLFLNTIQYLAVPEPSSVGLAIAAGVGLLFSGVRRAAKHRRIYMGYTELDLRVSNRAINNVS